MGGGRKRRGGGRDSDIERERDREKRETETERDAHRETETDTQTARGKRDIKMRNRSREIEQLCIVYPCICLFPKLICVHVSWILTVAVQHFGLPSPSRVVGHFGPMRFPQKWYFGLCKEYASELVHDIETV